MLGVKLSLDDYLSECSKVLQSLDRSEITGLSDDLLGAWQAERFVFVCGNGGAGSTAGHFAEDLLKSTLVPEDFENDSARRMKVMSLSENTSSILAWANDEGFERIFVEQLKNFASPGDVLIAMSGSGNSTNVLTAVEWANRHNLVTWSLTGYDGGELKSLSQKNLHIPIDDMGIAQSMHLLAFHWILDDLHARINGKGRYESSGSLQPECVQSQNDQAGASVRSG
ncbi:MAG: SIS domain-containing protein [Planctomycetota bacterium]|nr:SIS domain-containing protein [Planctomycetota bacterium]